MGALQYQPEDPDLKGFFQIRTSSYRQTYRQPDSPYQLARS
jgi:hypothetical protein